MLRHASTILIAVLLISYSAAGTTAATPLLSDTETPTVKQATSDGYPTFIITLQSQDDYDALTEWAASQDSRRVLSTSQNQTTATIRAPAWQVSQGFWARLSSLDTSADLLAQLTPNQLTDKPFVQAVHPNYQLSYAQPLDLGDLDNQSEAGLSDSVPALDSADLGGVAFREDAPRTTMADSRAILGATNVSTTGDGVTIAVIDTGANTAAGALFGANESSSSPDRILNASKNVLTNTTVASDGIEAVADGNGHGTWVASAAAANTTNDSHDGIAPDASLLILKALADDGSGTTSDITRAIRYAADEGADVITMSLGSPVASQPLANAIEYAHSQGVTAITVAAGNSRQTVRWVASPSDADGAIAVGATNGSQPARAGSAYFSQTGIDPGTTDQSGGQTSGETVDVAAPGMQTLALTVTESGGTNLKPLSGTSMATPMVAGVIALAVEAHPDWSAATLREWLQQGARPIPHAATVEVGHGMAAADNLITQTPGGSQDAAMTTTAAARNETIELAGDLSGGPLARWLTTLDDDQE
jgi:subtilisin family serine protease